MSQLDPGAVIGKAFATYRDNVVVLLPVALGVLAIQTIVVASLQGDLVSTIVAVILWAILSTLLIGIFVEVARDVEDGVLDSTPGQLIAAVFPAVVPLILVGILAGVLIGIGSLLIVPGLFLATIFAVVAPVTVLERPGVLSAFGRSRDLVRGSGWQVFMLVLFNVVLNLIAVRVTMNIGASLTGDVISWLVSGITAPLSALIIANTYLQLRAIKGEAPLPTGVATADGPLARPGAETTEPQQAAKRRGPDGF